MTRIAFAVLLILIAGCKTSTPAPPPVLPAGNTTLPPTINITPPSAAVNTTPPAGNVTLPPDSPPPVRGPNEVWIETHEFRPSILTVALGTSVVWTNKDSEFHTVTSDTGLFGAGLSFREIFKYTFTEAGTYNYHCDPHPDMTATIIVK